MNKSDFLNELRGALAGLPQSEIEERLNFYGEMIDDRIEEGCSEEQAVAAAGDINDLATQIVTEVPIGKIVKERLKPKRSLRPLEITLIALGFPFWFPLIVAFGAVLISVYAVILALIISLWAVEISFVACVLGTFASSLLYAFRGDVVTLIAVLGACVFSAGISVFAFYGCLAATKGTFVLGKKVVFGFKKSLIKKESAK